MRQKECNKRTAAALISAAYREPCLSLCVRRTLTLFLKVCRLVKHHNSRIAALFHTLWHFSRENEAHFTESWRVGKKCRNTLPTQIQRQTIKVWHVSYQKAVHQFLLVLRSFLHIPYESTYMYVRISEVYTIYVRDECGHFPEFDFHISVV